MYGHQIKIFFTVLKEGVRSAKKNQEAAASVLKRFAELFGARIACAMFQAWRKRTRLVKSALAMARRRRLELCIGRWTEGITEILALFRKVGIKCSHILAMLTGQQLQNCFLFWKQWTVNRVNSRHYAVQVQHGSMRRMLEWWHEWCLDTKLRQRLVGVGASLFRKLMGGLFGDNKMEEAFKAWKLIVVKQKRAKVFWRSSCLLFAWAMWIDAMQDVWAIKNEVRNRCLERTHGQEYAGCV